MFEIFLEPGTRILDVSEITSGPLSENALRTFRARCDPEIVAWPNPNTGTKYIESKLLDRCRGRTIYERLKKGETERAVKEVVPPENEIMVYAVGGTFSGETPLGEIEGKEAKRVKFTPGPVGGRRTSRIRRISRISRGRTFRSTSKRMNKNGRRLTRQSKHHVRNRDA